MSAGMNLFIFANFHTNIIQRLNFSRKMQNEEKKRQFD